MISLAAFALVVIAAAGGDRPWAHGLRARVAVLYGGLETSSLRLEPDTARIPDSLRGPERAASWELVRDGGSRPGGTEALRVVWTDSVRGSRRADLLPVPVARTELVPIASRRFGLGEDIDTSSLRWEWRRTDGSVVAPPPRAGLHGRRLRRGVGPGQELSASALEEPFVFRRGDRIEVVLVRGGANLSADGIALEDGLPGRRVRVRGPFGNDLRGVVLPDSSVRVE